MFLQSLASAPAIRIDQSHAESVMNAFSAVTITPFKNALSHFIPYFGSWNHSAIEMRRNDPSQEAMMPAAIKIQILNEIERLALCASLVKPPLVHTTLNHTFSSYGGKFSITQPIVLVPYQTFFRQGKSPFTQETPLDRLPNDVWNFTDDETRFMVSRQIAHISNSNSIVRLALKIALFTILYFVYANPLSLLLGLTLGTIAVGSYLAYERSCESKSDVAAVDILTRRFGNAGRARQAALSALKKIRLQNCERWRHNFLCRFYITRPEINSFRGGNNWLDILLPLITTRIEQIRNIA